LGPNRRLSGSEITSVVGKAFNRSFANANKFLVLDMEDLAKVAGQQAMSKSMVDAGLAPSSELLKAGQLLTADYILTSTIEKLKYSRKLVLNKKTNKFAPVYQMSIRMNYKLTDVTTGRSLFSNVIEAKLTNEEITALLAEDEECDLLLALMDKVTEALNGTIPQK
jgi:curli biogenesis system outer membrane secretion channel CsgG